LQPAQKDAYEKAYHQLLHKQADAGVKMARDTDDEEKYYEDEERERTEDDEDIYNEEDVEQDLEDDEVDAREAGLMEGYSRDIDEESRKE